MTDVGRVHQVVWDWSVLEVRGVKKGTRYRQEMVRTLYRLASTRYHVSDMLKLAMAETDHSVKSTLSWACYQSLARFSTEECQDVVAFLCKQLVDVLRHPCLSQKLLCCEMIYTLTRRGRISPLVLQRFDGPIVAVLHEFPRRADVVQLVARYFLLRSHPVAAPDVADLLPCAGLAWASAIEYVSTLPVCVNVALLAPLPSEYQVGHLVGLWSPHVQAAFIKLVAASDLETLRGECLLNVVEVLNHCRKVPEELVHAVPTLLTMMEELGHTTASEYRFRVWDAGWLVLEKVDAAALEDVFDRMVALVGRLPELTFSWSKDRIKRVFSGVYRAMPVLFLTLDIMEMCMVEVLPDALVHDYMDTIVDQMGADFCGVHHHPPHCQDMGCLKLICRMTGSELRKHGAFVARHVHTLIECISPDQPDVHLRVAWRQLLPRLPEVLFDACVPVLHDIIGSGDVPGLLSLSHLPATRLRVLRHSILHRVLTLQDIVSDTLLPSAALVLLSRLPDDVLVSVVERLVHPENLRLEVHLEVHLEVEKRLFILKYLPTELVLHRHIQAIAGAYLRDARPRVCQLTMDIILRSKDESVCDEYKEWCMDALVRGANKYLRFQAHKMLLLLPVPLLANVLRSRDLRQVCPRHVCALLDRLGNVVLSDFAEDIVHLCETYPYLDRSMQLLGRLPWETLWAFKGRVLSLLETRDQDGFRWDGSRHILNIYSNAGVTVAGEMLMENRYKDLLAY